MAAARNDDALDAHSSRGDDHAAIPDVAQGNLVIHGDHLRDLPSLPDGAFELIYIDPTFNTGSSQDRVTVRTRRDDAGDRTGFGGRRYSTVTLGTMGYPDAVDDYLDFIAPRLIHAHRLLADSGTLYFHIDQREAHYCKVLIDQIFGRKNFLNEVIWAYDYGGRAKDRWPAKHDTILVYVKNMATHFFDQGAIERIPYMAPGLVGPEKAARGKLPTDVWWHTIVPTSGSERTGYPNQKPEGVVARAIQASSRPGDMVLDFFAGSGTTGAVAARLGRRFVLIDSNTQAIEVMTRRFAELPVTYRTEA
ncbi:MAG: site-specific DNA-methyltransferase [Bifidobacteriaceae bacterium]|nr:site-specific DNA-methyltransferase [Bifidobacteriaceae bacterium]